MKSRNGKAPVPSEMEYTGCWVHGNTWLKVGLSKAQAQRLKQFSKTLPKAKFGPGGNAAWLLLNTALAHLEIMETLIEREDKSAYIEHVFDNKSKASLQRLN